MLKSGRLRIDYLAHPHRQFGANEVSCLIESSKPNTIERIQLEAEFYEPRAYEKQFLLQFKKAVAVIYPKAPKGLIDAIAKQKPWTGKKYRLTRERYLNGGYELRLERRY